MVLAMAGLMPTQQQKAAPNANLTDKEGLSKWYRAVEAQEEFGERQHDHYLFLNYPFPASGADPGLQGQLGVA